jgi:hypothetical protein
MEVIHRVFTVNLIAIVFFLGIDSRADSFDDLVTRYTTNCADKESSTLEISFSKVFEKPEDALKYSEEIFTEIIKLLGTNDRSYKVERSSSSVEPVNTNEYDSSSQNTTLSLWRSVGEMKVSTKDSDKASEAFIALTKKGHRVRLNSEKSSRDHCKKQM